MIYLIVLKPPKPVKMLTKVLSAAAGAILIII